MTTSAPTIRPDDIRLRQADISDAQALVALLDRCYRNDEGWTNESQLIGGIRTTLAEIEKTITADGSYVFVFEPEIDGNKQILACIGVQFTTMHDKNVAYIGTFAVSPELQGKGVGNTLLTAVETFAGRHATRPRRLCHVHPIAPPRTARLLRTAWLSAHGREHAFS